MNCMVQRKKRRSLFSLFLSAAMMVALIPVAANAVTVDETWSDGSWEGTGRGRNGDITVAVTVSQGKITKVENVSNNETPSYWKNAAVLFETIVEKNGTENVDTVSGATKSSAGIKEGKCPELQTSADFQTVKLSVDMRRMRWPGRLTRT